MKILVVGKPTYNVILPVENFLLEGAKIKISEKLEMGGGASFYAAYLLGKWGANVAYTGVIGSDIYGTKIKTDLESARVNTKFVEINYEHPTSFNYLIVNKANGSSTQLVKDNPEVNLVKYKYDFIPDVIIMDGTDINGSLAAINNFQKAKSIVLANRVSEELYALAKKATYVVANVDFAKALTKLELEVNKPKALVNFMQKIKDFNKQEYVIMMREHGVLYASERQVKMIPAINIEKKLDDTNAGYVFFGAFCYGITQEYGIDNAVKIANISAGLSLTKIGSLNAVPDLADVLRLAGLKEVDAAAAAENKAEPETSAEPEAIASTESAELPTVADPNPEVNAFADAGEAANQVEEPNV